MRGAKIYYLALVHVTLTIFGAIILALVFMHRRTILVDYSSGALRQQTSIASFILTEQTLPITGFEVIPYEYTSSLALLTTKHFLILYSAVHPRITKVVKCSRQWLILLALIMW